MQASPPARAACPPRVASLESMHTIMSGESSDEESEDREQQLEEGSRGERSREEGSGDGVDEMTETKSIQAQTFTAREAEVASSGTEGKSSPVSGKKRRISMLSSTASREDDAECEAREDANVEENDDDDDEEDMYCYEDDDDDPWRVDVARESCEFSRSEAAIRIAHSLGVTPAWVISMQRASRVWAERGQLEANLNSYCHMLPRGYRAAFHAMKESTAFIWIEVDMGECSNLSREQLRGLQALCETAAEREAGGLPVVRVLFRAEYALAWEKVQVVHLVREFPTVGMGIFESSHPPKRKEKVHSSLNWILQDRLRQRQSVERRAQIDEAIAEKAGLASRDKPGSSSASLASAQAGAANSEKGGLRTMDVIDLGNLVKESVMGIIGKCLLCASELPLTFYRPIVCDADRCVFQAEELKLGASVEYELLENWEVLDFMLVLLSLALGETGYKVLGLCMPKGLGIPANAPLISELMKLMPSMSSMRYHARQGSLRDYLNTIDPQLYPLLGWVVGGGCRTFLRLLKKEEEIPDMGTVCQFQVVCPVEKELRFRQLQRRHGSFLAFHGSPATNWHSIVRMGLKNFSEVDEYRRHGASYGSGIYLAEAGHTSSSYVKPGTFQWTGTELLNQKVDFRCQAVCEVVHNPGAFSHSSYLYEKSPRMTAMPEPNFVLPSDVTDPGSGVEETDDGSDSGAGSTSGGRGGTRWPGRPGSAAMSRRRPIAGRRSRGDGIHVVPHEAYVKTSVLLLHGPGRPVSGAVHEMVLPKALFPYANTQQDEDKSEPSY